MLEAKKNKEYLVNANKLEGTRKVGRNVMYHKSLRQEMENQKNKDEMLKAKQTT